MRLDPAATIHTRTGGPAWIGDRPLDRVPVPATHVVGLGPGANFSAILRSTPGWLGIILLGRSTKPDLIDPIGALAIDSDTVTLAVGRISRAGLSYLGTVPPGVLGSPIAVQGAVLDPAGNLWLGNPAVVVLHTP